MDFLNLIQNSIIVDQDGDFCGHVRGFEVKGHRLILNVVLYEAEGGDDDGGSRADVPEDDNVEDLDGRTPLKLVGGTGA